MIDSVALLEQLDMLRYPRDVCQIESHVIMGIRKQIQHGRREGKMDDEGNLPAKR